MKTTNILATSFALLLAPANAHYVFSRFILEGKWTETWEYVRQVTPFADPNVPADLALAYPNTFPDSIDLRCGRNATLGWSQPKVAAVKAGDRIGFGGYESGGYVNNEMMRMYHPGIASAFLSRFTGEGELDDYEGDGEWVKIMQTKGREAQSVDFDKEENKRLYDPLKQFWGTFQAESWNFTIPSATPSGKYLVRFEHIFPNVVDAQFYVNCAQLDITNDGTEGTWPAGVKIPGLYTRGQEDVYFSTYDYGLKGSLDGYTTPKPDVWTG